MQRDQISYSRYMAAGVWDEIWRIAEVIRTECKLTDVRDVVNTSNGKTKTKAKTLALKKKTKTGTGKTKTKTTVNKTKTKTVNSNQK